MSYFYRLPISVRHPLMCACGTLAVCKLSTEGITDPNNPLSHRSQFKSTDRVHREYNINSRMIDIIWPGRHYIAVYGGKSLIARTDAFLRGTWGDANYYSYGETLKAVEGANRQAFWWFINKYESMRTDSLCIYKYILSPMIKLGMNRWLQEYLQKFPDTAELLLGYTRRDPMVLALRSLDPITIELMIRAGFEVNLEIYHKASDLYARLAVKTNQDSSADHRATFYMTIWPILRRLREENPNRNWGWYNLLFPLPEFPKDKSLEN